MTIEDSATSGSEIPRETPLARAYNLEDQHVADLFDIDLVREMDDSPYYQVYRLEQESEPTAVTQVGP